MENDRYMPAQTDPQRSASAPRSVAHILSNPQDEVDEQMGLTIRDQAHPGGGGAVRRRGAPGHRADRAHGEGDQ